jgi:membrane-bound lytic murein transglycosylase A
MICGREIQIGYLSPPGALIRYSRPSLVRPFLASLVLVLLTACESLSPASVRPPVPQVAKVAPSVPNLVLTPVTFAQLPGWAGDRVDAVLPALRGSCQIFQRQPPGRRLGQSGIGGKISDWRRACAALARISANTAIARRFFEQWFDPFLVSNRSQASGLFTGYYEIELRGSRSRTGAYQTPLYSKPKDIVSVNLGQFNSEWSGKKITGRVIADRVVPAQTRREIDNGALSGRGIEILWVDNPIDAFFLHIQGSGRVVLEDGSIVRVGYAGRNGHKYVAIGRELVKRGAIAKQSVSMQSIRSWLRVNKTDAQAVMQLNPSYIFFRQLQGPGPVGAQGVVLTPGRSLAVDRRFIPLGVPIWLATTSPLDPSEPLNRLVIAQDTGGAIKGPVRGDLYWGHGENAALNAGFMKSRGRYYVLLPKPPRPAKTQ